MNINTRTLKPNNIFKSLAMINSDKYVVAKYSATRETKNNWGDAINTLLIEKFSMKKLVNINDLLFYEGDVFSVVGSILDNNKLHNLMVWGSGLKSFKANLIVPPKQIFSVRGPLTQQRLESLGIKTPKSYGDPAVLYKEIYTPRHTVKEYDLGIIPHYVDKSPTLEHYCQNNNILYIDIQGEINEVVDQVSKCRAIASSSLHGLIISDMYDTPSTWIKISDNIQGDDFKFYDYYASVFETKPQWLSFNSQLSPYEMADKASLHKIDHLIENLKRSNPFHSY